MTRKMSELVVKLTDQVSGPARKVAQALKMAERQTKAIAAATKAGLGTRFTSDLQRMGANTHQIDRVTRAWQKYRQESRLAADATKWTKSQTAAVRTWERANIAALKSVNAAKKATGSGPGHATPQPRLAQAAGGMSAGQGAMLGAAASRASLIARAAPVVAVGAAVYKATSQALEFEKVMYQVEKATDSSGAASARYSAAILDMSVKTGSTAKDLGSILASAGFAGRPKEELLAFTSYAAKAANAWETTAGDTGQALAEIGNIYGANQARIEAIGDAINGVADASASKETDLLDFIRRTGATAKILGITAEQALAFGAAFREIGVTSEIAATGMNALLMKLATGVGDSGWEDQIKGLGIPVKMFNATLKKDAPAAIKILLGAINKIGDGTKKMSVLKEMFGQEYADDIARLSSNLGGLERMLGFVGDKAKFLGSVDKSFELLKEKDYNRLARFSAQMDRLAISVGGPLKTALGAAADQASRLFESFQEGGAAASVIAEMAAAAQRFDKNATSYVREQIAKQEAEGAAPREYDPDTRKAVNDRRDFLQRGVVDRRVAEFDSQIGEKQKRLDGLPKYPRLRAGPEAELTRLRADRQGLIDALSAQDKAKVDLLENSVARNLLNTRQRGFGDYYGDKPTPIAPNSSMSFGLGSHGTAGAGLPQSAPFPPPRPDSLPKAVPMLKSFEDIYSAGVPKLVKPEVDTTSIDAAKDKAAEAKTSLDALNGSVSPQVDLASLERTKSLTAAIVADLRAINSEGGRAVRTVAGIGSAPAGRGRSDVATATANLSRSRQTNMTDRSYTG